MDTVKRKFPSAFIQVYIKLCCLAHIVQDKRDTDNSPLYLYLSSTLNLFKVNELSNILFFTVRNLIIFVMQLIIETPVK